MNLDFNAIISRVMRVFTFDLTVFQEVEEDQAAAVMGAVIGASVIAG